MKTASAMQDDLFRAFCAPCIGLSVSHIWRGVGSAVILEFGELHARINRDGTLRRRRDGSLSHQQGDFSLLIEWSWRVETNHSILGGSWGNEKRWPRLFEILRGNKVDRIFLFGRIPELCLEFSNKMRLLSFNTSDGDPGWVFFDRRFGKVSWINVKRGSLHIERSEDVFEGTR